MAKTPLTVGFETEPSVHAGTYTSPTTGEDRPTVQIIGHVIDGPKTLLDRETAVVLLPEQIKTLLEAVASQPEWVEHLIKLALAAARADLGHKQSLDGRIRVLLSPGSASRRKFIREHIKNNTGEPKQVKVAALSR